MLFFLSLLILSSASIFGCELTNTGCDVTVNCNNSHTVLVPRQLSYNPVLENALTRFRKFNLDNWNFYFSLKPIYTKSVGDSWKKYFNIQHKTTMDVRENGTGDIDPLWFEVISSNNTFYSSQLSLYPETRTYGALLNFEKYIFNCYYFSINTAIVTQKNKICISERDITNAGTVTGITNMKQAFDRTEMLNGKICNNQWHKQTGVDDIQLKIGRHLYNREKEHFLNLYGLFGIPTGRFVSTKYLFEPRVGSKHAQFGLGANGMCNVMDRECNRIDFLAEIKWRYGIRGKENRLFDLKNGEWSRYLLFVDQDETLNPFPASNKLALQAEVSPRNALDIYLAFHWQTKRLNFEIGYDMWYRQREKVVLNNCSVLEKNLGIADLRGIANLSATTSSTTNISQSVAAGSNQMTSDATFTEVTKDDIDINSAAQPRSLSNSFYFSAGVDFEYWCNPAEFGLNVSYEKGTRVNTPDQVLIWANLDLSF